MKVSIYGVGYVGLITGTCLAHLGHSIICYDTDESKINRVNEGIHIIYEKNFETLLKESIQNKEIKFTKDLIQTINFSDIHMICVGTPSKADGSANLAYLFSAVENVAKHANKPFFLIIKSTVPVGTSEVIREQVKAALQERNFNIHFDVISCPEFLTQGDAINSFMNPDRIIIGTHSDAAFEKTKELFHPLTNINDSLIIRMSPNAAELAKYASNCFLATKISFVNEISRIAELTGSDINEVIKGVVSDKRIGPAMSRPGCGFGGSCLPKDLKALIHTAEIHGYELELLSSVLKVNKMQKNYFIDKILSYFSHDLNGSGVIAIWGLSFKPNTDDIRESVSCNLISALLQAGARIQAYDPVAGKNIQEKYQNCEALSLCDTKEEALNNADCLVVMTDWSEFYDIDPLQINISMRSAVLFDGRNMYDPKAIVKMGIKYYAIGNDHLLNCSRNQCNT